MEHSICIFGDSTAWGAWDLEKGGWVNRLWLELGKRNQSSDDYYELYNLSVSGGTTETILERFESEAKVRHADILIFQTGGNDAAYNPKTEMNLVDIKDFEMNIGTIISRAKEISNKIAFIGFKDIDESKTTPVAWVDLHYTNKNIHEYNDVMREVCTQNNIPFIDVSGILDLTDFTDGIHPNVEGHEKLYKKISPALNDLKFI